MSDVEIEMRDGVQWIRLNKPERLNAYDESMVAAMIEAIEATPRDMVIAVTGSGRGFCAGGYLAKLADASEDELRRMFFGSLRLFDTLRAHPSPVIAAVNGAAVGGGNELVVACDLAIAVEDAFFGQTGPRVGSAPVLGGTNLLAINIGEKRAKEVVFLTRRYGAREALEMGWINAVVAAEELEGEVVSWARELYQASPRYLEIAKQSSNVWWNQCRESYLLGEGMLVQAIGSEDMIEGATAFMEKRSPRYPRSFDTGLDEGEGGA
jgi:2-ketocyclohexanecarboxyl-CoA hydrolase